ncbi:MAG: hypothetical protein NDI69_06840 [Bacteriovoracaceae bacterium]|nr:hypothetical protein [Bacteriovoracaceae bacterium]
MKTFILIALITLSLPTKATSLLGEWASCVPGKDGMDMEHILKFREDNVQFEVHGFSNANKEKPCTEEYELLVGTYWFYQEDNIQLTSTAFSHYIIIGKESAIPTFNKEKICGISNWKVKERVECTDDESLSSDLPRRGTKTKFDFLLKRDELHIIKDGQTHIYIKRNKTPNR